MQTSLFTASIEIQLTELRAKLARELNTDPAKVWSGKVTEALLDANPQSLADLELVKGLTKKKVKDFGPQIIAVFSQTLGNNGAEIKIISSTVPEEASRDATLMESFAAEEEVLPEPQKTEKLLGVSDYLDYVNQVLKVIGDVKVIGEISKLTNHPTGIYLTLKDKAGEGVLDCYINPYTYRGLGMQLEEGMEIKVTGTPGIFKRRSQLSFRVDAVELAGEGTLKKAYELLKKKLEQEGIFDRKRELPEFISSLGLITSKTGAVIDDFRKNLEQRGCSLYLKDCRVEGNQAAGQIIRAIKYFNIHHPDLDCLVVMRGGGSLEDMQAFNSEAVIKEVFASRIPVIAALGHDRDVPLTCLAADTYTSTPTAAAMLINNSWARLTMELPRNEQLIFHKFQTQFDQQQSELTSLVHQLTGSFNTIFQRFEYLEEKLLRGYAQIINAINHTKQSVLTLMTQVVQHVARNIQYATDTVNQTEKLLATASPERSLRLGYSLAYDTNGKLIRSMKQVAQGDKVDIKLSDGTINTEII